MERKNEHLERWCQCILNKWNWEKWDRWRFGAIGLCFNISNRIAMFSPRFSYSERTLVFEIKDHDANYIRSSSSEVVIYLKKRATYFCSRLYLVTKHEIWLIWSINVILHWLSSNIIEMAYDCILFSSNTFDSINFVSKKKFTIVQNDKGKKLIKKISKNI
jgi:hypothetical protein